MACTGGMVQMGLISQARRMPGHGVLVYYLCGAEPAATACAASALAACLGMACLCGAAPAAAAFAVHRLWLAPPLHAGCCYRITRWLQMMGAMGTWTSVCVPFV